MIWSTQSRDSTGCSRPIRKISFQPFVLGIVLANYIVAFSAILRVHKKLSKCSKASSFATVDKGRRNTLLS